MATLAALDGGSGAASAQRCAAAPSAGSVRSADFVCRASPARREGGRCGHVAPPLQASATTSTPRRRLRWNSGCSTTRWISAPLPRPVGQPGVEKTAATTMTPELMKSMYSLHYEDSLAHRDDNIMAHANPQLLHLASPIQAAQQAVAWILVAAQHDIARRDGVIAAMRSRWWRQLGSCAIHHLQAQAQQCHLRGLRRAYQKAQQLAIQEQQLENNEKTCMKWWRQLYSRHSATEQRRRFQALLSAHQRTQQLRTKELRLETIDMAKAMERLQVQIRDQETEL